MPETCAFPLCRRNADKNNKYCIGHKIYSDVKEEPKKLTPIKKVSDKAKKEAPAYRKFVAEYLSRPENKLCKIKSPVCSKISTAINHKKRRFKETKMNEEFIEPCCSECNIYIEQHDAWARERGHLLSKFK